MPAPWIIALGLGALFVAANWDKLVNWLKDFTRKVANALRNLGHAAKIFAQKVGNKVFQVLHRVFYKEDNQWYQETTRTRVDESEVPEWAKAGVAQSETDVTDRYQRELSLTL